MKNILHIGAWGRNYGDHAILEATQEQLTAVIQDEVQWHEEDIQQTDFEGYDFTPYDAVLVGGGGLLWDKPELDSYTGWQWRIPFADLMGIRVPLFVHAIGFTRFPYHDATGDTKMWSHVRIVSAVAKMFSVRNSETRMLCRQHGIRAGLIPCPAMFLSHREQRLIVGEKGVSMDETPTTRPIIGLVWASDKPEWRFGSVQRYRTFLTQFAYRLHEVAAERDATVLMIEHIADLDREARAVFRDILGWRLISLEESVPYLYPANRENVRLVASLYSQCEIIFSARKHGIWLAAGRGVPAIPIGDLKEVHWTANSVGTGRYGIQYDDVRTEYIALTFAKMALAQKQSQDHLSESLRDYNRQLATYII